MLWDVWDLERILKKKHNPYAGAGSSSALDKADVLGEAHLLVAVQQAKYNVEGAPEADGLVALGTAERDVWVRIQNSMASSVSHVQVDVVVRTSNATDASTIGPGEAFHVSTCNEALVENQGVG